MYVPEIYEKILASNDQQTWYPTIFLYMNSNSPFKYKCCDNSYKFVKIINEPILKEMNESNFKIYKDKAEDSDYIKKQKKFIIKNNIHSGSLVKITHKDLPDGWDNIWIDEMNKAIGNIGLAIANISIDNFADDKGIIVYWIYGDYLRKHMFPYTVLEPVTIY